ncbi:MAG: hypothetical protein U1E46_04875 [Hyphomicrobiales bacterium]
MLKEILGSNVTPLNPVQLTEDQLRNDPALLDTEVNTIPMFGDRPVILVRQAGLLALRQIESLIADGRITDTGAILAEGEPTPAVVQAAQKLKSARVEILTEPVRSAATVLHDTLKRFGLDLEQEARDALFDLTAEDAGLIEAEVEKLAFYAGGRTTLTVQDVRDVCVDAGSPTVEELLDTALAGNLSGLPRAMSRARESGANPQQVAVFLVQRLFRSLRAGQGGAHLAPLSELAFQLVRDTRSGSDLDEEYVERALIRLAVQNRRAIGTGINSG